MQPGMFLLEMLLTINIVKISIVLLKKEWMCTFSDLYFSLHWSDYKWLYLSISAFAVDAIHCFYLAAHIQVYWIFAFALSWGGLCSCNSDSELTAVVINAEGVSRIDAWVLRWPFPRSGWSSPTHPRAWEKGRGQRRVGDRGAGPGVCPSESERGSCRLALRSREHQKVSGAKIWVRAHPGYWEETHGEVLGRSRGNLPSPAGRSPPLSGLSPALPRNSQANARNWRVKLRKDREGRGEKKKQKEEEIQAEKLGGKNARGKGWCAGSNLFRLNPPGWFRQQRGRNFAVLENVALGPTGLSTAFLSLPLLCQAKASERDGGREGEKERPRAFCGRQGPINSQWSVLIPIGCVIMALPGPARQWPCQRELQQHPEPSSWAWHRPSREREAQGCKRGCSLAAAAHLGEKGEGGDEPRVPTSCLARALRSIFQFLLSRLSGWHWGNSSSWNKCVSDICVCLAWVLGGLLKSCHAVHSPTSLLLTP